MTNATEFIAFLTDQYKKEGWEPIAPDAASPIPNFVPDLMLRKNDEYLVIDVKEPGYKETRALNLIRKLIEMNDGWKFEIKIIPFNWNAGTAKIIDDDIKRRIEVAKTLAEQGHNAEAYILSWTAIEGLLRTGLERADTNTLSSSGLIRRAFEEEMIDREQRQALEAGVSIRSRLVHGISHTLTVEDVARLLGIAVNLAGGARRGQNVDLA